MMSLVDQLADEIKDFFDQKIPQFLVEMAKESGMNNPWEMPVIEDFVIGIAVRDVKDGDGTVMSFTSKDSPTYRIRGLLHEILGQ